MPGTSRRSAKGLLIFTALCGAVAGPAWSQQAAPTDPDTEILLDAVTVFGSRAANAGPDTRSMAGETLERRLPAARLADILSGLPGVSTQVASGDPGVAVNVGGMQDFGRVTVLVDGARQNFQKNGHGPNGTVYLDTEMLKEVSVTSGAGAAGAGGGAIGGVVRFATVDADDILAPGVTRGGRARLSFSGNGDGPTANLVTAARMGDGADVLLGTTWRDIGNYTSGGGARVQSAQTMRSFLLKGRFRPADGHELSFSASRYDNDFMNGAERRDVLTETLSAGYRLTSLTSDFWDLDARVYSTRTRQREYDIAGAQDGAFNVRTTGIDVSNTARLASGHGDHTLRFGFDTYRDRVATSSALTPDGTRCAASVFIQDTLRHADWLEVVAGLRWDSYRLANATTRIKGNRLSPQISVTFSPRDWISVDLGYSEGYRGPALTESLIEGTHPPPVPGRFFPNPDLRPEIARTLQAGATLRFADLARPEDSLSVSLRGFQNNVTDYIDQVFLSGISRQGYQYQNIAKARVRGLTLSAEYDSPRLFGSFSAEYLKGVNLADGSALQKVPPYRIVATAGLRAMEQRLNMGARLTVVGGKRGTAASATPRYETLDLFATYRISDRVLANVAVNNLFDRDYTQFLNTNPSPGRNVAAALTINF